MPEIKERKSVFSKWSKIRQLLLEAGSLTTPLSSIMLGWFLTAFKIFIYLFILLFLTGLSTLITTFLSLVTSMPV